VQLGFVGLGAMGELIVPRLTAAGHQVTGWNRTRGKAEPLIAQGMRDVRVVPAESEQMVKALKANRIPVTYLTFPDEGHGFVRPENRLAFAAVAEAFLAKHLGGQYQPLGNDFAGSTIRIETGGELVPGLTN